MNATDNSARTRLKYDLIAKHNVRAYRSAYSEAISRETNSDFILKVIGKLLWYCIIYPALYLLHFVFQFAQSKLTNTEFRNKHLKNPLN